MSKLINAFRSATPAQRAAFLATMLDAAKGSLPTKGKATKASEPKVETESAKGRAAFRAEMRAKYGPKWYEHPEAIAIKKAKRDGFKAIVAKSKAERAAKAQQASEPRQRAANGTFLPKGEKKAKGGKKALAAIVAEAVAAKL